MKLIQINNNKLIFTVWHHFCNPIIINIVSTNLMQGVVMITQTHNKQNSIEFEIYDVRKYKEKSGIEGEILDSVGKIEVEKYGSFKGWVFSLFGLSSKTETGEYINRHDFFMKLAELALKKQGKLNADVKELKEIVKAIEKDNLVNKYDLKNEKVTDIFSGCLSPKYNKKYVGKKIDV